MRGFWVASVIVSVWLFASPLSAQTVIQLPGGTESGVRSRPDPGAFARGAAIYGAIGAGLLLGGAVAMAVVPDAENERITRGVWLGTFTLSVPFVALGGWTARHRADVEGYRQLRILGFSSWVFGI